MTYQYIVHLQFEGFGYTTVRSKPLAVEECAIGTLHVPDEELFSK